MQQLMPKYDFNKVSFQFDCNRTSAWVLSCKFAAYFQRTFSHEHLWTATYLYFLNNLD